MLFRKRRRVKPLVTRSPQREDLPILTAIERDGRGVEWTQPDLAYYLAQAPVWGRVVECQEIKQPVAYLLSEVRGSRIELTSLAVEPAYRRRGIGTSLLRLLQGLHDWPRRIRCYVPERNTAAQLLLRSCGFVCLAQISEATPRDESQDTYHFEWVPRDAGAELIEAILAGER